MTRSTKTEAGSRSPRGVLPFGVAMVLVASCGWAAEEPSSLKTVSLTIQTRDGTGKAVREPISIDPRKTAVVVIDMWDRHWCQTYTARVANLVPRMNRTLESVRKLGIQVVFAPSDVVGFYEDCPQRRAMLAVPPHPLPEKVNFNPPGPPPPTDNCECGSSRPCQSSSVWTRQHAELKIADGDLIGDCNHGRELLNLCAERAIDTLLYLGVASNMCVQYRSMGIRQMKSYGLRAIVVADSTRVLLAGRWSQEDPEEPVAWTNTYADGRVFYTTLGHPGDFQIAAFNHLLRNAIRWALEQD